MKREQKKQLKSVDEALLRTAFVLQNMIRNRAGIDSVGTMQLVKKINETLQQIAEKGTEE